MKRAKKFKHKKSLGQNFLTNDAVIDKIIDSANIADSTVIEIGPGQGILTEALACSAKGVIAIELDERLISDLENRFSEYDNVEIIHGDILHMNVEELVLQYVADGNYKVVANIPYYITAPIIRLFLELSQQPQEIVLMVQKEVAERLTACPGAMSVLAVSAQYYADVTYLFTVPKEDFDPVPKVDSAIISLKVKSQAISTGNQVSKKSTEFFRVVKIGFSAKRKTLCNNLANGFSLDKKDIECMLQELNLKKDVRAQELSVQQWKELVYKLSL